MRAAPARSGRRPLTRFALCAALLLASLAAVGQENWPDTRYSRDVPPLRAVLGHDFGADITAPEDLLRYLQALAESAPDRTRLVEYARSWEGRPLHYLVIGSPQHMLRLDEIRTGMQRLADPRGLGSAERDRLLAELPAVVWLAHGVHGDEISSSDAALLIAYHLLAAEDEAIRALLNDVLVVIDPSQNPDGRARFVQHYRSLRGPVPQASPIAAERSQRWPGGRANHYLFDMNRDWFALTQPEVRGRVRAFLDYYPLVYVDLHEMGTDATYYFPPPAVPWNPYLTDSQRALLETLGRGNAAAFDRLGFRYYTRETFDAYYPGYGDTWPALQGAAGMTFEMASARGLLGQRSDGSLVSYEGGVRRHFTASLATVGTAARERRRMLKDFVELRSGPGDDTLYLLSRAPDPGRADKLVNLLLDQGIEVRRLVEAQRLCGARHPAGTYLVSADQPAGRLVGTLLAAESPASAEFWQEQERRAAKRLPVEIYDVVAWSLPLLYDVTMTSCRAPAAGHPLVERDSRAPAALPVKAPATVPGKAPAAVREQAPAAVREQEPAAVADEAAVAYLVPWGTQAAARFLAGALRSGLRVETATESFIRDGESFPRGTLILHRGGNNADLPQQVAELTARTGAAVRAADTSWMEHGIDLGSDRVRAVPAPRIALAWDDPTSAYSAGAWRYLLEQKLGYPVTPVRVRDLGSPWLDQFDVLVLPEGEDYDGALGEQRRDNLVRWVKAGGTLVTVGAAVEYAAATELLAVRPEQRAVLEELDAAETESTDGEPLDKPSNGASAEAENDALSVPGTILADESAYRMAIRPEQEPPRFVPGVLVQASLDPDHWLSVGLPERLAFMVTGQLMFTPLKLDQGTNVAVFQGADTLVAGGRLWQETRRQLARKPAVMSQAQGRGQVIGFAADPSFRGMMDGLDVLVGNALFFGPAAAEPVPAPPPVAIPAG